VLLSIVIPAYNEQERLPIMLDAATSYVNTHRSTLLKSCQAATTNASKATSIEWIIVSDGSTDDTCTVVRDYAGKQQTANDNDDTWKLCTLQINSGKGAAVKTGMLRACGELRLMVDADGATDFGPGLERVLATVSPSFPVVFGSRAHLSTSVKRSLVRTFLMHAFHFFVTLLCTSRLKDTQCGFKLFTKRAALLLFDNLHLRRWAFDTELVMLANQLCLDIAEVAVPWHEVDGSKLATSKLSLFASSVGMLRDMLCVRACYALRLWHVKKPTTR
jgi:dolichyl-phosphate beta-glucosyltransferase